MGPEKDSFCIVYTIKNERDIIRENFLVHFASGCKKIFLFLDNTTDDSGDVVKDLKQVVIMRTKHPSDVRGDLPGWLDDIIPDFEINLDRRKRFNAWRAGRMARDEGIEWMFSIDADEILYSTDTRGQEISMTEFLRSTPEGIDQILLPNSDVVVSKSAENNPFRECIYFLNRFPATDVVARYAAALTVRVTRSPKAAIWARYLVYYLRFKGKFSRILKDPITEEQYPVGFFLGYANYKSAIRVSSVDNFMFNVHKWQKFKSGRPKSVIKGRVLHYDLPNYAIFLRKFRQRHASMNNMKAIPIRYLLAKITTQYDESVCKTFFDEQICIPHDEQFDALVRDGVILRISSVQKRLEEIDTAAQTE